MQPVVNSLIDVVRYLGALVFSAGSLFSPTSLGCALLIGGGFLALQRLQRRRRVRWRTLLRALFPRRFLRHPSLKTDIGYWLFNTFVYASIFGMMAVSYEFLTNGVLRGLIAVFGPVAPSTWPEWATRSAITLMLFLAYEFGYWVDHWLKHRVPALWELHKVHHTAAVLTPLTVARIHPLDAVIFGHILAVTAAVTNGVGAYLFGDTTHQYALAGNNLILFVFVHLYVHLQHTHLWIAFRGWMGRIFLSPAHHQIHHSTNPLHFNRNLGSCLALFDWLFGTLHVPARTREKLTFGVEPAHADANTITGEFLSPVARAATVLLRGADVSRPGVPAPEPALEAQR